MARFNLDIWNQMDWAFLDRIDWQLAQTATFVFFFEVVLLGILLGLRERRLERPSRPTRRSPFEDWTMARRESNAAVLAATHTNTAFGTTEFIPGQPVAKQQKRFIAVGTRAKDEVATAGISPREPWAAEASWDDLGTRRVSKPRRKISHRLALPSSPPPIPRKEARAKSRLASN
jgi:hypothetical protein